MKSDKDLVHAGKRRFLRNAAASTAGLTAMSMFLPAIRRALAIPANNRTGTINDVEHVVILMQENRSFDMYFGTYKGVRGFGDRHHPAAAEPQRLGTAQWHPRGHAVPPGQQAGQCPARVRHAA